MGVAAWGPLVAAGITVRDCCSDIPFRFQFMAVCREAARRRASCLVTWVNHITYIMHYKLYIVTPFACRADYHGDSINMAARIMDAAAHGGMVRPQAVSVSTGSGMLPCLIQT